MTADEIGSFQDLRLKTRGDGEVRQQGTTDNLIFGFAYLVHHLSTFMTLNPGHVIAAGTPTGAGARFQSPCYLKACDIVEVEVSRVGTLSNPLADE